VKSSSESPASCGRFGFGFGSSPGGPPVPPGAIVAIIIDGLFGFKRIKVKEDLKNSGKSKGN